MVPRYSQCRSGFWHVQLDEPSSYTIWPMQIAFGTSSAPEIFQRRMHELVKGLTRVDIVVDDFIVVGQGSTNEAAAVVCLKI